MYSRKISLYAMQRIELGLALISPSQKPAASDLGALAAAGHDPNNPSTDGTNHTTEELITSPQPMRDAPQHPVDLGAGHACAEPVGRSQAGALDGAIEGTLKITASEHCPALGATDTAADDVDMCTAARMTS